MSVFLPLHGERMSAASPHPAHPSEGAGDGKRWRASSPWNGGGPGWGCRASCRGRVGGVARAGAADVMGEGSIIEAWASGGGRRIRAAIARFLSTKTSRGSGRRQRRGGGGGSGSSRRRNSAGSPSGADSTGLRVSASASLSSCAAALRDPISRPAGLPDCPSERAAPAHVHAVFAAYLQPANLASMILAIVPASSDSER